MMTRHLLALATLTVLVCVLFSTAMGGTKTVTMESQVHAVRLSKSVPGQLNYQGFLADAADSSAVTATLEMTFRIYDSETEGTELWTETHTAVQVANGLFQVLLGGVTAFPADLFDGSQLWLQTEVGTQVLAPRKPLVSVAYSRRAEVADHASTAYDADYLEGQSLTDLDGRWVNAEDLDHLDASDGDPANALSIDEAGKVGIGTSSPLTELDVSGSVNATTYYGDGSNLTGISGTTDNDWTINGNDVYHQVGNVGIGTDSPAHPLDVHGMVNTDSIYGIGGNRVLSAEGSENIFVGIGAGENSSGGWLTFVGQDAGRNNQASWNTFYGCLAGTTNTTGSWNTFLGMVSGRSNTEGNWNTFVGMSAGESNTTGDGNTFLGISAGGLNTTGSWNTFLGIDAGGQNIDGSNNVFIGKQAGHNETGSNKLYIANGPDTSDVLIYGDFSAAQVGIGTANPSRTLDVNGAVKAATYYGDGSNLTGISGTTDNDWTIDGDDIYHETGNVGIGTTNPAAKLHVTYENASASTPAIVIDNSYVGSAQDLLDFRFSGLTRARIRAAGGGGLFFGTTVNSSLNLLTNDAVRLKIASTGEVGIGTTNPSAVLDVSGDVNADSLYRIRGDAVLSATDSINILVGIAAGENNTGEPCTFLGYRAGKDNQGGYNTFIGDHVGGINEGHSNTYIGSQAGLNNTTGNSNTFVGRSAGRANSTGRYNTFVGDLAGFINSTGIGNTFLGKSAGYYTTGDSNVFIGHWAGYYETGSNKLYIANDRYDSDVLIYGDFSTKHVGIGTLSPSQSLHIAGHEMIQGPDGFDSSGEQATLYLGDTAKYLRATYGGNTTLYSNDPISIRTFADSSQLHLKTNGRVGVGTDNPTRKFWVNGDAGGTTQWYNDSDERLKKNISRICGALDKVDKLEGVYFEWKDTESHPVGKQVGLIAQEVAEVVPEVVQKKGEYYSLATANLVPVLIEAIKEQQEIIAQLEARIEALESAGR